MPATKTRDQPAQHAGHEQTAPRAHAIVGARAPGRRMHHLLLNEFAPAAVVTDARFKLVDLHGRVDNYLTFTGGAPPDNLLANARRGLRACLRELVVAALDEHAIVTRTARVSRGSHYRTVELSARCLDAGDEGRENAHILVTFRDMADTAPTHALPRAEASSDHIRRLEHELSLARADQQGLVEELQAANQAREQALSENDGLRSRSEQLTTSNAELHAQLQASEAARADLVDRLGNTEQALAASEARFRLVYEDNPAMYFIVGSDARIVSANEYGAAELGYTPEELAGESFAALHVTPGVLESRLADTRRAAGERQRWELELCGKNGERLWARANARAMPARDDAQQVFVACENISNEKRLGDEARFHATHDALTGLINRGEFEAALARAIDSARVKHAAHVLAYVDIDHFKIVNDTHGYQAGDEMLRQITHCFTQELREEDLLARIGGDKFAILMTECTPADADDTARRLIAAIDAHEFLWEQDRLRIGASIGLAPIDPHTGRSVQDVLRAADAACFTAKELGPGSIHRHTRRDDRANRRRNAMNWANRIGEALADGRVHIDLQPIVDVRHPNAAPGYEALLRMHDADGAVVDAGEFMDAAVRYGLMQELDRFALARTLLFMSDNRAQLRNFQWVGVNVSAQSLVHPEFLAFARRTLGTADVDPAGLCFEITETSVISNLCQAKHFIREMKRLGCTFALDDFGTGLSSFDYLRSLPVEHVKIDGSFIRNMRDDVADLAMVEATANIAHLMGKTVIAECVETADLLDAVRGVDIEYAQGYYYGEPSPIESLLVEP